MLNLFVHLPAKPIYQKKLIEQTYSFLMISKEIEVNPLSASVALI